MYRYESHPLETHQKTERIFRAESMPTDPRVHDTTYTHCIAILQLKYSGMIHATNTERNLSRASVTHGSKNRNQQHNRPWYLFRRAERFSLISFVKMHKLANAMPHLALQRHSTDFYVIHTCDPAQDTWRRKNYFTLEKATETTSSRLFNARCVFKGLVSEGSNVILLRAR